MSDKPLIVISDPPAAVREGGAQHGVIELQVVQDAIDVANKALSDARYTQDIDELSGIVHDLASAVVDLAGEVYGLARGVQHGRVHARPLDE